MSNGDYVLRPEAGPVKPGLLNRSQRDAFRAIVAALVEANRLAQEKSVADPVQRDQVSRLFFVSGQPGSGKTSLYRTLRHIIGQKERLGELRQEYNSDKELSESLSDLVDGTRWLEPIDLEVAVDEGENLLAAVLVRIFQEIREPFAASQKCRDALQRLEELANDIGIAWDGNLKDRAGSLDPDSYSQEVMRGQHTRLGNNKRLRVALETLFDQQCYGLEQERLFVLPIDDFYLKPAASLELLRLLRMISVPRLFFLIMGDIKTVEALFFEKALADWTDVAGSRIFVSLEDRQEEVLARVREMKARYLRKLLPVSQRAHVEWTRWDETLKYRPTPPIGWVPQMCHLLSGVVISWQAEGNKKEGSLLNYLVAPRLPAPQPKKDCREVAKAVQGVDSLDDPATGRLKKFREAYSGALILDATHRELFDLWTSMQKVVDGNNSNEGSGFDSEQNPPYLRMIVDLAVSAIEEQDFLKEQYQEILRFVFPRSKEDDFLIWTNKVRPEQKHGPWRCVSSSNAFVRRHFEWELRIVAPRSRDEVLGDGVGQALPPRVAAWIILLHDLVWNWKPEYLVENLVHSLRERVDSHRSVTARGTDRLDPSEIGWFWYKDEGNEEQWRHLPFPKLDTFRELDRFLSIWNHKLEARLSRSDPTVLELEGLKGDWNRAEEIAKDSDAEFSQFVLNPADEGASKRPRR